MCTTNLLEVNFFKYKYFDVDPAFIERRYLIFRQF